MFREYHHRKLWGLIKESWELVRKFGLMDTKIFLRRSYLGDEREIPNSCYACEYAYEKQVELGTNFRCKYCPIEIEPCTNFDSIHSLLKKAISTANKTEFERLCDAFINAPVKRGIECEVIKGETGANHTTPI